MDQYVAWLLLLAPLASAIFILCFHRRHAWAMEASIGSAGLCFFIALSIFLGWSWVGQPVPWTWLSVDGPAGSPGLHIEIAMQFDALSKGMLLIVTGVGFLVHVFSYGYMEHDKSRGRFFGGLSIFMFSMTGIVLATNLIELFIFWEGVGLSSYLLVGFWYTKESAAVAANKAFICNRIADVGFMIGILTCWSLLGNVSLLSSDLQKDYAFATHGAVAPAQVLLTVMVLGLFAGCVGKSAMFPLHVWLPDAMEGPTPVSALIHAATMVAAGVYMLCRVYPLLLLSEAGMFIIACVGCFTAIFAALIALQQNDIKRILAYSTLSQLGYMVMAVGCGGPDAAMFHLSTHAFFKALLFLAAGSVIHALHEEQDIWHMGGLRKKIPLTFWTFTAGYLALSGVPPFAGFFSKDYLLSIAYERSPVFYWVGVVTAALTAFYMTRLVVVAFFGNPRTEAAKHPHESPWHMTTPLVILAILSCIGGFIGLKPYYSNWKDGVLQGIGMADTSSAVPSAGFLIESGFPMAFVLLGLGLAIAIYKGRDSDPINIRVLARKFYFDEFYDRSIVGGQQLFAIVLNWFDSWIIEGLVIRGGAYLTVGVGEVLRLFQTGSLQTYVFIFTLGGTLLIYFTLFAH